MPQYNKTTWVNDTAPAIDATNLNKIEQGIFDSVRQDGSTTMSAQLVTIAGTGATPAIAPTGDSNTGIYFPAADTIAFCKGGLETMRIDSNGSICIGSPTPQGKLTVYDANSAIQTMEVASGGTGLSSTRWKYGNNHYGFYVGSVNALVLYDYQASAERMRITSAGNVGIGTTSPQDRLHIVGQQRLQSGAVPTSNHNLIYHNATASVDYGLRIEHINNAVNDAAIQIGGADTVGTITFQTNTAGNVATSRMAITAAGNVGIGTTSPTSQLHVYNNGSVASLMVETNTTGGDSKIALKTNGTGGRHWYWQTGDNGSGLNGRLRLWDSTASAERLTVTDAGFLGIGVVPNAELHIKGTGEIMRLETTAATGDNFIRFYAPSSATKGFIGYTSSGNDHLNINNVLSADLLFHTNNIERLRIESGGTTRPAANNTYDLGNSSFRWATIYAQNALNTSDARLKTDIAESSLGLDFVTSLNPVQFRYIEGGNTVDRVQTGTEIVELTPAIPAQSEVPEIVDEEGNVIQEYVAAVDEIPAVTEERPTYEEVITPREGVRTHFGLLAQEVKAALPEGQDFAGWALADKDDPESTQFLNYSQLIAPMIKAIQELNTKVEALEAQLAGN